MTVSPTAPITASLSNQTLNLGFSALSCSAGNSIRAISATGVVTCEPDDDTIIAQSTIEGYARSVCCDQESELTAALNDNYLSLSGGTVTGNLSANGNISAGGSVSATSVTAGSVNLSAARTEYLTISGALFMDPRDRGVIEDSNVTGSVFFTGGQTAGQAVQLYAALNVPSGALLTGGACRILRTNSADRAAVRVVRVSENGTASFAGSATLAAGTAAVAGIQPLAFSMNETVEYPAESFHIYVELTPSVTTATDSTLRLHSCYVSYTRSTL